jgi:hypothetical protein
MTKTLKLLSAAGLCLAAATVTAQEPAWNASAVKACDCARLVGVLDGYMNAMFKKDPKAVPPLSIDVRMTENTAQIDVGEGARGDRRPSRRASRSQWPIP